MFNQLLRTNKVIAFILTFIRLYLGYTWFTGGIHKLTGGFDAGGFLQGAIAKSTGDNPTVQGWWATFLENAALPSVNFFNVLIPLGETLVGLGLILGMFTTFAALMAMIMNSAFLLSGTISTNVQMLLMEMFIVVAAANGGRIGLDRWVIPYLRNLFPHMGKRPISKLPHLESKGAM
ncbi:DoxX family protein [Paenibacillus crassostreae]|uniref:Crp/Fnr family transcriptional regulator n=1 Tax=Paenibacillus crassostreae TaxID=1763538 RepID=A0A167ATP2_9BACL|nr:DoxX family protein [Paenibacillus crassostreae]AOZ93593.1 Crp/Fnr family transcriptional regulator [Paenibacillus crassostreae]OAB71419.1 Crp/Fnr family transcriptional regulator [Paenibacillus crassostreae]